MEGPVKGKADDMAIMEETCLQIIAQAGDAKSKVYEALEMARAHKYEAAMETLAEAQKEIARARQIQHSLLTSEARGNGFPPSILLSHAMDILITAESECNLAIHVLRILGDTDKR
jgi:PTS system cellobiose-specific IIA component